MNFLKLRVGTGFLLSGQAFQAFVGFGANLILVRYLYPEEFGRFALMLATIGIVFSFFSLNMRTIIVRTPAINYTEELKKIYFSITVYETIFAFFLISGWLFIYGFESLWEIFLILAMALRHIVNTNLGFFERTMPFKKLAVIETFSAVFAHVLSIIFVFWGMGKELLYAREIIVSVASLLGFWLIGALKVKSILPFWAIPWSKFVKEARGLWLDTILENSFNRISIILIHLLLGDRMTGYFFQAQRLAGVPLQLLNPLVTRVAGIWFGRTEDRTKRRSGRNILLFYLAVPLIFLGIICYMKGEIIIPFLFGENWLRSGQILRLMAGVVIFHCLFEVLKSYCWQARQMRWFLIGRVAQYLGCGIPLFWFWTGDLAGEMALALGQSFAYLLGFTSVLLMLERSERSW